MRAFSSCGKQGLLFVAVCRLFTVVVSLVVEHGLYSVQASIVVAPGLCCLVACEIFPDQGSNLCPLHRQADSYPLDHKGSQVGPAFTSSLLVRALG